MLRLLVPICLALLSAAPRADAHALSLARAEAVFRSNGTFRVELDFDVLAFMAGVAPKELSDEKVARVAAETDQQLAESLSEANRKLAQEFVVLAQDGSEIHAERVELPSQKQIRAALAQSVAQKTQPSNFIGMISGKISPDTTEARLNFPEVMGAIAVKVTMEGRESFDSLQLAGQTGPPYELGKITNEPPMSRAQVLWRYLELGFTHIVPDGLDHVLFVLGLFLLSTRFKPLLVQITAFTIAHTITLGLAMYGVVSLPSSVVEPAIALSIAFVAIENICSPKLHAWRPVVVFFFGLLHGLGFAGALRALGLPRNDFAGALIAFNIGVECGQLAAILGALLLVGWFLRKPWYRRAITIPASLAIADIGVFWAVQRIFF